MVPSCIQGKRAIVVSCSLSFSLMRILVPYASKGQGYAEKAPRSLTSQDCEGCERIVG